MRVLTFSRQFPDTHPRKGSPTFFVDQILLSLGQTLRTIPDHVKPLVNDFYMLGGTGIKFHTIRAGNRWIVGDMFSARVWSGLPYRSKQVEFAQLEVKEVMPFTIQTKRAFKLNGVMQDYANVCRIAANDGLSVDDFECWFPDNFEGQVISWCSGLY